MSNCPDCRSPIINQTPTLIGSPICLPDCPANVGCADIIASPCVVYTGSNLACTGLNQGSTLTDLYTAVELICANQYAQSNPITLSTKVSLTADQILLLHTNPVELIPNPGVGKFINILSLTGNFTFGTIVYDTNITMNVYYPGSASIISVNVIISSSADVMIRFALNGTVSSNQPLMTTITNGNPLNGDGILDFYITYTISTI